MTKRTSFLLRVDPSILNALRKWADDELRSVNGQVEFLLRQALKETGRLEVPRRNAGSANDEMENEKSGE